MSKALSVARPSRLAAARRAAAASELVRLSVDIPDELRCRVKHQAIRERRSVRDFVIALLEKACQPEIR